MFGQLLREAEAGAVGRLVFTAPTGAAWHLPLYELALLTERRLVERGVRDRVELALVTPEDRPLQAFGPAASDAVTDVLDERGVEFLGGLHPDAFADGILSVLPRASIPATHVVALPRLEGAAPGGLPHDRNGFVAVDRYCRVRGIDSVYAAGDVTTLPVKQGGLAAQQADAAASSIAADLGLGVEREPFSPVLRGLLLTGGEPQYLRADIGAGKSDADVDPLWWPPAKIVGRHLAPYLAARAGVLLDAPTGAVVPVEIAVRG